MHVVVARVSTGRVLNIVSFVIQVTRVSNVLVFVTSLSNVHVVVTVVPSGWILNIKKCVPLGSWNG